MKVLHIMPYTPIPQTFGGAIRNYHMVKNLTQHHDVTVVTFGGPDERTRWRREFGGRVNDIHLVEKKWSVPYRRAVQFYSHLTGHSFFYYYLRSRRMQQTISRLLAENDYDVVQMEFAQMGIYHLETSAVKILDAHNVEYDTFFRIYQNTTSLLRKFHYYREYQKFYHEEIETCSRFDALLVTSDRDRQLLDQHVPQIPRYVLPNGVDCTYFSPSDVEPEPNTLVFTGLMSYVPNHDGMMFFLDEILPRVQREIPDVKVYIVGNKPRKELLDRASRNVIVTGFVEDVRPYISRSSVYVVPLRMGGGTRLKVTEALAMRKPIVTTALGCEGIEILDGESSLIRDTPETFADAIIELLHDASLRQKISQNGHDLIRACYDWSVISERQETYYQTILQNIARKKDVWSINQTLAIRTGEESV